MNGLSESVRIVDWLATRVPAAPASLAKIIADHVGSVECAPRDLPERLIDIAMRILRTLGDGREAANDLLAADALITYAIEAAADAPERLEQFSMNVAERIAREGVKS